MRNITHKSTGDTLTADEFNNIPEEEENLITSTGQTLTSTDLYQMAKAAATYASVGDFFLDSGSANNYVLTAISPMQAPVAYVQGMRVRFIVSATNTSTSAINLSGLGAKNIVSYSGLPLIGGELLIGNLVDLLYDGTAFRTGQTTQKYQKPFVNGLIMSNNSVTPNYKIDTTAGSCSDTTNSVILTATAFTKDINAAWAAGTGNGGLASACSLTAATWYHYFIIGKTAGTTDFGFDTSVTATNLLSDAATFTYYKRIGSVLSDASSHIIGFNNTNEYFHYKAITLTTSAIPGGAYIDLLLNTPPNVVTLAKIRMMYNNASTDQEISVISKFGTNAEGSVWSNGVYSHGRTTVEVLTDTAAKIQYVGGFDGTFNLFTVGWKELR